VSKDTIKDAPNVDDDEHVSGDEQNALYEYYGDTISSRSASGQETGRAGLDDRQEAGYVQDTAGYASGETTGDEAMTRSEERLNVGKETVEAGRARLRKHVVTENVTRTVPVSHAVSGEPISEDEHEVTLRAERPVVEKETVPVERVRLATDTVTEDAQVSDSVRKEQIDDVDVDNPGRTR
jgi:stress response protein YsnF